MTKKLNLSLVASLLATLNIYAQEDLGTITVSSATKSEQSIKDVTTNVEVITKTIIQEKNFKTVSEALNSLSGISVVSNGGIGQLDSIYIRGVDSKRILILIDGIRYNEPAGLSGAPLAQLMVDDIERIEVIKGAQSGIWGADASGGVINIISSSSKKGTHTNISIEGGSFNTKKYSATVSNSTDNYFVKLNANKITTDGYSSFEAKKGTADYGKRGDELGLEDDGYKNLTYSIQSGFNITTNDKIKFLYKKIDAQYDYDSSTSDDPTKTSDINHYFKSLSYFHDVNNYQLKVSATQSKFNRTQETYNAQSKVNEFAVESKINYTKDGILIVGLNKQNFEDINNGYKYNTQALFVSNSNIFDKLILSEVLRYDDNSAFDKKSTGKFGVKYNFTKDLNIASNYGTAYNAPTLGNLSYTPTLRAETTKSFDLSAQYKSLTLTYFDTKIKDMINYSFTPSFHYINEDGISRMKGYEVQYINDILDDILLTLNYTHLSAKDSEDKDLARRAKETLKFGIDYYGFSKLHLGLNGEYLGERYDKVDKQGAQTGKYTVANLVVNYDITKAMKIYGKVDNITDKYYQTIDGYATSPRAYYAGVKVSF